MIDLLAYEKHFLDHAAPVWLALPSEVRGRAIVEPDLVERAKALGITAMGVPPPRNKPSFPKPVYDGLPALVASYGDIKKGRRMGFGPFVFLEHGIGQSYAGDPATAGHASYSGGNDRDDVELFLVPGENPAARWRERYPQADVSVVGSPRLDSLPKRDGGGPPVVAVSFHFKCSVVPETRPAIDHFEGAVRDLAQRYKVIGHGHPRYFDLSRTWRRLGIPYVADFADVCRQADVYVCDNSSTIYEFAATGRPVVLLNAPTYRKHISHGLRFWTAADVGVQVDEPRRLADAVETALADAPAQRRAREKALGLVYAHRTGGAERAAAAITEWAMSRQAVAA